MSGSECPCGKTTTWTIPMDAQDLIEYFYSTGPFEDWAINLEVATGNVVEELGESLWDTRDHEDGKALSHSVLAIQHDLHQDIVLPKCDEYAEKLPQAGVQATLTHELMRGFIMDNMEYFQIYLAKLLKEYRETKMKEIINETA